MAGNNIIKKGVRKKRTPFNFLKTNFKGVFLSKTIYFIYKNKKAAKKRLLLFAKE